MEDTLIVVHTYKGNEQRVRDLMPWWTRHEQPVLVLSPAFELNYVDENGQEHVPGTDPSVSFDQSGATFRAAGAAGWKGSHTIHRQIEHWKIAAEYERDWYMMFDDDSICVSRDLPEYLYEDKRTFWSNEIGTHYLNYEPPYFFSREVLLMLIAAAEEPTAADMTHVNAIINSERGTLEGLLQASREYAAMDEDEQAEYRSSEEHEYSYDLIEAHLEDHSTLLRQLKANGSREVALDWGAANAIDGFYVAITESLGLPHQSYPDGVHHYPAVPFEAAGLTMVEGWRVFHGIKGSDVAQALTQAYDFWSLGRVTEREIPALSVSERQGPDSESVRV